MNLLVPVEWILQINHAVQQHHVGAGINSAFTHHQVLLSELTDQKSVLIHHRQATDVVIAQQTHGIF